MIYQGLADSEARGIGEYELFDKAFPGPQQASKK